MINLTGFTLTSKQNYELANCQKDIRIILVLSAYFQNNPKIVSQQYVNTNEHSKVEHVYAHASCTVDPSHGCRDNY